MNPGVERVDVAIVGAGPSGMLAAAELQHFGVETALFERRADYVPGSRAIGIHSPVLEALEPCGATARILEKAARIKRGVARARHRLLGTVRFETLGAKYPFAAAVQQSVTEAAIAAAAPQPVRDAEVLTLSEASEGVRLLVRVHDTERELLANAVIIAGGPGARALLPGLANVRSRSYPDRFLMTDTVADGAESSDTAVIYLDGDGVVESFPLGVSGRRLVAHVSGPADGDTVSQLCEAVAVRTGDTELAASVSSASGFGIRRFVAPRMRWGRIFAIGDAAHEISPIGGQGMNLGLLDAASLAPLLARWLLNEHDDSSLESWQRQRVASARRSARIAELNTIAGRPASGLLRVGKAGLVAAALRSPVNHLATKAYGMGYDAYARARSR